MFRYVYFKYKLIFLWLFSFIITIYIGILLASRGINGGQDPIHYFNRLKDLNNFEDIIYYTDFEFGYHYFLFLLNNMSVNENLFLFISAFLPLLFILSFVFYFLKEKLFHPSTVFIVFILLISSSSFIFLNANALRQYLAICIICLSLILKYKNYISIHFFLLFLSCFFHSSTIPIICVYLLFSGLNLTKYFNKNSLIIVTIMLIVSGEVLIYFVLSYMEFGLSAVEYYRDYAENSNLKLKMILAFIFVFSVEKLYFDLKNNNLFLIFYNMLLSIYVVICLTYFAPEIASRMILYFNFILIFLLACILKKLNVFLYLPFLILYFLYVHTHTSITYVLQESSLNYVFGDLLPNF